LVFLLGLGEGLGVGFAWMGIEVGLSVGRWIIPTRQSSSKLNPAVSAWHGLMYLQIVLSGNKHSDGISNLGHKVFGGGSGQAVAIWMPMLLWVTPRKEEDVTHDML